MPIYKTGKSKDGKPVPAARVKKNRPLRNGSRYD